MEQIRHKRIVYLCIIFLVLFTPIMYRLGKIQLVQGDDFYQRAFEQRTQRVPLESELRGDILDRHQRSLLGSYYEDRLIIFPNIVEDMENTASLLAALLGVDLLEIHQLLNHGPTVLPYTLTEEQIRDVKSLNLQGVLIDRVWTRYGDRVYASNLIGHLGKISSKDELNNLQNKNPKPYMLDHRVGKLGLEYIYEGELKGTKPERSLVAYMNAKKKLINGLGIEDKRESDKERFNLRLTIDLDIQKTAEDLLEVDNLEGAVVVMDSKTGDLLGLASRPSYHPNRLEELYPNPPAKTFLDQTISLNEPGSIFKVVLAVAGLEEGVINNNEYLECQAEGCLVPGAHTGHNYYSAMIWSCNSSFSELGKALGYDLINKYVRRLGLNSQRVLGYPYQRDDRQDWGLIKTDLHNSSIGQGPVLASPIQITAMMNTIANDGIFLEPRLVMDQKNNTLDRVERFGMGRSYRAVSKDTAKKVEDMLVGVTRIGTGKNASISGVQVAGKTGTAQTGANKEVHKAWFSGYFPVENPRYTITVLINQGDSGGGTAAPIFRKLGESILSVNQEGGYPSTNVENYPSSDQSRL